ncbi:MAG: KEOPS complex subunit Pcc1 [Candidatus Bathyarchaeia archaeon]
MNILLKLKVGKLEGRMVEALKMTLGLEVEHLPSKRYRGAVEAAGDTVFMYLKTRDLQALRAAVNSYARYISVGYYAVKVLNPET